MLKLCLGLATWYAFALETVSKSQSGTSTAHGAYGESGADYGRTPLLAILLLQFHDGFRFMSRSLPTICRRLPGFLVGVETSS